MSRVRHKFGPSVDGVYPRPDVPGEKDDVEIDFVVSGVVASANPGLVDITVTFTVPPHDLTMNNQLLELHAIAYPPGHGVHTDPKLAISSAQPKASTAPTSAHLGGDFTATIAGVPSGALKILSVLGFTDPTTDAAPADSDAPGDATPAESPPASDPASTDATSSDSSDPASSDPASSDPTSPDATSPSAS